MTAQDSILFGIIQGITEFLPVSSSAHYILAHLVFDVKQVGPLFDIFLHLGTLLSLLLYFKSKIVNLIKAFFGIFFMRFRSTYFNEREYLYGIIIASIPTGIIGLILKDRSEALFNKPVIVGYCLIITSVLLYFSDKNFRSTKKISFFQSFLVGISQGLAVIPGISRSGTTIFTSLLVGIPREKAAEFSFLISIPAILGALLLKINDFFQLTISDIKVYLLGMVVSFFVGIISISFMLRLVRGVKLKYFALYCLIFGIFAVFFA